jgi:hypothetical protein
MIQRSEAFYGLKCNFESGEIDDSFINEILDVLAGKGVEFAPEEPSAVEKWEIEKSPWLAPPEDPELIDPEVKLLIEAGDSMRDELQARIKDLESQVDIIADENQSLEKRIEEKDAEIAGLKSRECNYGHMHPCDCIQHLIPESSELVKARENSINCEHRRDETDYEYYVRKLGFALDYIEALENARLRGGKC